MMEVEGGRGGESDSRERRFVQDVFEWRGGVEGVQGWQGDE